MARIFREGSYFRNGKVTNKKIKTEIGPRRQKDIVVSIANSNKFKKNFIGNQNSII
jgi:UDP-glucose 4-epimerase